jgi:hypothetical protein
MEWKVGGMFPVKREALLLIDWSIISFLVN